MSDIQASPKSVSNDASQQALKKAQGMLRQLNDEKQALITEKASLVEEKIQLQAQIGQLDARIKQLQNANDTQKMQASQLQSSNTELMANLTDSKTREQQLKQAQQQLVNQAKNIQSDNTQLVRIVKEREILGKQCIKKNSALIESVNTLLNAYRSKNVLSLLEEAEPFTGIANIETQNLDQTYQFKLEDLKVTPIDNPTKGTSNLK